MPEAPPDLQDLAAITHAQARRVMREARMLLQLAARLKEATGEDTNDSPEEGTHDRSDST
jgi:hypothetical protein